MVWGDPCTEVSETTKVWTDEQERDKRHDCMGKQPHHCKALWIPKYSYVDSAGLDRRTFTLPREVLSTTSWLRQEVSRGHSTKQETSPAHRGGLTSLGRTERQVVPNSIRKLSDLFGSSLILNKDKGAIGEKSDGAHTWRTAVYETRTYGGVRGSPHQFLLVGQSTQLCPFAFISKSTFYIF